MIILSKLLAGSREDEYYVRRYHDEDWPQKATISVNTGESHDYAGQEVIKLHWSLRNFINSLKFRFEWGIHGNADFVVSVPFLFTSLSLPNALPSRIPLYDDSDEMIQGREIGISFHHWTLFVDIWQSPHVSSPDDVFRWSFNIKRALLGKNKQDKTVISRKEADVYVPGNDHYEGYNETLKMERQKVRRTRENIPFWEDVEEYINVKATEKGIRHPGKGTTAYNCGDGGLWGKSYKLSNFGERPFKEAAKRFVQDGLKCRNLSEEV